MRLIEYSGHGNSLISSLAFEELQKLSGQSAALALRLLEPYWRTIAVSIVKDMHKRPQVAQSTSDLLGVSVTNFLRITQFYTIPYLVLTKRKDVLQRIADSNGPNHSIVSLCMEREQLAAILACLLLQPAQDPEHLVISLLSEASPDFAKSSLTEIFKADPTQLAYELLKAASEPNEDIKARAHSAIQLLAEKTHRRHSSSKGHPKKHAMVGIFFEECALGVMQLLSDVVSQHRMNQSVSERKRCIGAIQEMAILAKSHLCNALPQVCSCLRSAIEDPTVCNEAFLAWMTLMKTLDEEDIESLVDPTFAIVAQHWDAFGAQTQQQAHDMISLLLKTHAGMVREIINTIPSLGDIPLLRKFETELGRLKAQMDPKHQFQAFSKRCQNENATVVTRALTELNIYLESHQSVLHSSAVSEQPDPVVAQLTRSLLGACLRFCESNSDVAISSARCLGFIGCLDPTKIEVTEDTREIFLLSNFTNASETIDFIVFFIQEVLVKAFLSTTDTRSQGLVAFVIQELLRYCGFDASNTLRRDLDPDVLYKRWIAIPEATRNTLTPFLTSKYFLELPAPLPEFEYPLYDRQMAHQTWLRHFVFDLMRKSHGENVSAVFSICRCLIRRQDIAIPNFLLPFAALNVVLEGTVQQRTDIAKEFLMILSQPLPDNNQNARESLILCSHVSKPITVSRKLLIAPRVYSRQSTTLSGGCKRRGRSCLNLGRQIIAQVEH